MDRCVQSDIRAFGITADWKATTLKAEVWIEAVTDGGRRFMAAWRKEKVDAARHRQEKREATRLGKKGGGGGGGGRCQTFFFFFFLAVQQTTSGIGHRVKKFSSGWQPIR